MKQTLEQAAEQYGRRIDAEHPSNAATDFLAGVAWQKQQGIEWIPATDGALPKVGEYVMVLLEGEIFLKGKIMFDAQGSLIWVAFFANGEHPCQLRSVTHYAFINLPKIDE